MTTLLKAVLPVLAVIFLTACGSGNADKSHPPHESDSSATAAPVAAGVHLRDDKLNAVYPHYVQLTTALTNGDMAAAKIAASAIAAGAGEITGGAALGAAAANIMAATDIDAQRTLYAGLSTAFIALVKQSGLSSGALYVDFCPMAMHDKGASWLSAGKEIKNPYFGEKMMTCGDVKETILPATAAAGTGSVKPQFTNVDAKVAASLKAVVAQYLQIKNGLAEDNSAGAANGGKAMAAAMEKADKTAMTPEQQQLYKENEDDLKEHAEHIGKNEGNIEHQREHFAQMSEDVYALVKAFGGGQTLYHDYCPMYNDNKGARWISETEVVKNPYFGSKMATCGSVKEVMQ
ncbi:DUF3347 domain-containing protein [Chitinophaga sp. 22321]|uniref:DUF3347 domain-containing protein n=1 Tax=Chitinophaga hostae TaxID=2831022 RepID=A0ABS5J4B4_9BACT|nr:DUF3347 domain-containing protein [Chitinophaga hostae]MBS0030064.1 DUF3347 domain-containing protein [Chitinophaga hostae]